LATESDCAPFGWRSLISMISSAVAQNSDSLFPGLADRIRPSAELRAPLRATSKPPLNVQVARTRQRWAVRRTGFCGSYSARTGCCGSAARLMCSSLQCFNCLNC
jgi:hypothetical protein